jgi:predicted PurR-regulated permease PerM
MRNALRLVPPARRERYSEIARKLGSSLRWWFVGRFSSMAVTGLLTGLGLWIAQVPMALTLGLIAGVLSFVPFAGPIAASIPGILVAWVQGPTTALYALIVYVAVQLLESNLVTPLIERRAVSVPPALLVGGQLLFGSLYGFWGVLWATPLIVVVMVLVQHLYIEDVLHESAAA